LSIESYTVFHDIQNIHKAAPILSNNNIYCSTWVSCLQCFSWHTN